MQIDLFNSDFKNHKHGFLGNDFGLIFSLVFGTTNTTTKTTTTTTN
jgi:hypothetical protein